MLPTKEQHQAFVRNLEIAAAQGVVSATAGLTLAGEPVEPGTPLSSAQLRALGPVELCSVGIAEPLTPSELRQDLRRAMDHYHFPPHLRKLALDSRALEDLEAEPWFDNLKQDLTLLRLAQPKIWHQTLMAGLFSLLLHGDNFPLTPPRVFLAACARRIGMLWLPQRLLHSRRWLTPDQWHQLRDYPLISAQRCYSLGLPSDLTQAIHPHLETSLERDLLRGLLRSADGLQALWRAHRHDPVAFQARVRLHATGPDKVFFSRFLWHSRHLTESYLGRLSSAELHRLFRINRRCEDLQPILYEAYRRLQSARGETDRHLSDVIGDTHALLIEVVQPRDPHDLAAREHQGELDGLLWNLEQLLHHLELLSAETSPSVQGHLDALAHELRLLLGFAGRYTEVPEELPENVVPLAPRQARAMAG